MSSRMNSAGAFDSDGLQVGDYVLDGGRPPVTRPGEPGWYALRVAPQRETFVERWLALRDVMGFHPVLRRQVMRQGKAREVEQCFLPGYVFARFRGAPVTHRLLELPYIIGAVTAQGGAWAQIKPDDIRALYDMRHRNAELEDARAADAARRRAAKALRTGGRALFKAGPFAGEFCDVVEIRGPRDVTVRLHILGSVRELRAEARDMVNVRKAG